jgi:DNA-binding transcriptional MerR regulator
MTNLLTIPKLAKMTGISEKTLRAWYHAGWLQAMTYSGARPYFSHEAFERAAVMAKEHHEGKGIPTAVAVSTLENDRRTYQNIAKRYAGKQAPATGSSNQRKAHL